MGGNVEYRRTQYSATMNNRGSIDTKVVLNRLDVAESVQKLKGNVHLTVHLATYVQLKS